MNVQLRRTLRRWSILTGAMLLAVLVGRYQRLRWIDQAIVMARLEALRARSCTCTSRDCALKVREQARAGPFPDPLTDAGLDLVIDLNECLGRFCAYWFHGKIDGDLCLTD